MTEAEERRVYSHVRALLAETGEGLLAIAPDRTIRLINEQAALMFEATRESCIGAPVTALGMDELGPAMDSALETHETVRIPITRGERDFTVTVAPYQEGDEWASVLTVRDESGLTAIRRRAEAVLMSVRDGLMIFDAENRITFVNPAAERLLGRGAEALVGLITDTWRLLGLTTDSQGDTCATGVQTREVRLEHPEHRIIDVRVDRIYHDHDGYLGAITTLRDVTAEREAAQMKNEFISTVSHELRTPLTSIKGYVDLILDGDTGEINEMQREFLSIVKENSDRLVALINDMLDISRIESGRIVLKVQPLDLAERIAGAAATFGAVLEQQGRRLIAEVPDDLPLAAGDPDRVGQVLTNFISNAVKYSPAGGDIHVRADVRARTVRVGVSDSGIGIAPEHQERLFTKFYRVDSTVTRDIGGTGLGLSICKSIIELLGGEVGVESEPGVGSTFWFTLPVAPERMVRTPTLAAPTESPGGTVLVVDESEDAANLISTYLSRRGYEVVKSSDVADAWRTAVQLHPSAITLDVMLGGGAGFELLQKLRAEPETADIPVAVVSIACDEGKSRRLGATAYLEKPIEKVRLLEEVDRLVGSAASPVVLVADDDHEIVELLSSALRQRGCAVMSAYDGREAMAAVARTRPDAILLDLCMPLMDGYEVLNALKRDPATADIPVLVMSGLELDAARMSALGLASLLVGKPFDAEELADRIETAISGDRGAEGGR